MNSIVETFVESADVPDVGGVRFAAATAPLGVSVRLSRRLWLGFFFVSIAVVGAAGVSLAAPWLLIGRGWRAARVVGETLFQRGVALLLWCQPWLRAEISLAPIARPPGARGVLYVANHRSTLDVFCLLAHVPGVRILAKRSLLLVPFLGAVMLLTRQLFVGREPASFMRAMQRLERGLRRGDAMHVFPEYTRCPERFVGTQKFSAAPFQAALAAGADVVPIVFCRTDQVWPKGVYGLSFRVPVQVRALAPIPAGTYDSPRALMLAAKARIDAALAVATR